VADAADYARVQERLGAGPGLLYRNERNSDGREGAFALCSFWLAEFLARGGGSHDDARDQFDQSLAYANDVGLVGEEIDPSTGDALGNFPQAFTHMGLINAAISLAKRDQFEGQTSGKLPMGRDGTADRGQLIGETPS
jgi:GH15 family glucan-1,4-alpha-glucosidase